MKETQFIENYQVHWDTLEKKTKQIQTTKGRRMPAEELKAFLDLLKRVNHHLAYAKTYFPQSETHKYLNNLSVRANNQLYRVKGSTWKDILFYATKDFPERVLKNGKVILFAMVLLMASILFGYVLVLMDIQNAAFFLPEQFLEQAGGSSEGGGIKESQFAFMSGYIMVNNIGVAIKSFAFGIGAGVMTLYVVFFNGAMLGALSAYLEVQKADMANYWSLILPHGFIELTAIVIAAAAGLKIGYALLVPGQLGRISAVIKSAKEGAMLMPGVIGMLVIAGLIEGFITPSSLSIPFKFVFAGMTVVLMGLYFGSGWQNHPKRFKMKRHRKL